MRSLLTTTALASGMLLAATAYATPFSVDFGVGPLGDLGPTHSWTNNGVTVTATVFGPGAPDLFAENIKPEDVGLGETKSPHNDNEITSGRWVQFQFSPTLSSLSFFASSTSPADTWAFYGSNTPDSLGTFLVAGDNDSPVYLSAFLGKYAELDLTALPQAQQPQGSNDTILAGGFSGSTGSIPTPEPGTLAILGSALLGLWWLRSRRTW